MNTTIHGTLFDGHALTGRAASLHIVDSHVELVVGDHAYHLSAADLRVSPIAGSYDRFITIASHGQLQCADAEELDRLPQEEPEAAFVAWMEERVWVAVACVVAVALVIAATFVFGMPRLADFAADHIDPELERQVGVHILESLDTAEVFEKTKLQQQAMDQSRAALLELTRDLPTGHKYHLEFRHAGMANAFALPGGTIVITDGLHELLPEREQLQAILAHEIGHVHHRDAVRKALRDSVGAVIVALLTSDAASFGSAIIGAPLAFSQAAYSRQAEAAADEFAFTRLKQIGLSPNHFADALSKLQAQSRHASDSAGYLDSHPDTAERVAAAHNAAKANTPDP